jgi:4'-phosphopantetheinyl transferase
MFPTQYLQDGGEVWMDIPAEECQVWTASLTEFTPYLAALDVVLSEEERAHAGRFLREIDRARARVSRAVLRLLLADYLHRDALGIQLDRRCPSCGRPHGKPKLAGGARPNFSVSHAGDLVVFAFADVGAVGVDVEPVDGRTGTPDAGMLETAMAPAERRRVREAAADDQWRVFLRHWTYKEAVLKQLGVGLSHSLPAVVVEPAVEPQTVIVHPEGTEPVKVRVAGLELDAAHVGAAAMDPAVTQLRLAITRPADHEMSLG